MGSAQSKRIALQGVPHHRHVHSEPQAGAVHKDRKHSVEPRVDHPRMGEEPRMAELDLQIKKFFQRITEGCD